MELVLHVKRGSNQNRQIKTISSSSSRWKKVPTVSLLQQSQLTGASFVNFPRVDDWSLYGVFDGHGK